MRSSRSPTSFGTRTHAVTCALWTSSAAERSTIVSIQLPPGRNDHTVAQGPQKRSSLTVVLAAQSGVPGRPRTPNSKQAHGHQGKENGVAGDAGIIAPFHAPARVRDSGQMNSKEQPGGLSILGPWFPSRGDRAKARCAEKAERDRGGRHGPARTGSPGTR